MAGALAEAISRAAGIARVRGLLSTDGASAFAVVPTLASNSGPSSGLALSTDGNIIAAFGNGVFYISVNKGMDWATKAFRKNLRRDVVLP